MNLYIHIFPFFPLPLPPTYTLFLSLSLLLFLSLSVFLSVSLKLWAREDSAPPLPPDLTGKFDLPSIEFNEIYLSHQGLT